VVESSMPVVVEPSLLELELSAVVELVESGSGMAVEELEPPPLDELSLVSGVAGVSSPHASSALA
jgi:hypothetical protein